MADQVHCYFFMLVPPDHDTKALIPTFTAVLFFLNFDSNATEKLLIMTRCQSDIDADFVYKFLIFAISLNLIERGLAWTKNGDDVQSFGTIWLCILEMYWTGNVDKTIIRILMTVKRTSGFCNWSFQSYMLQYFQQASRFP